MVVKGAGEAVEFVVEIAAAFAAAVLRPMAVFLANAAGTVAVVDGGLQQGGGMDAVAFFLHQITGGVVGIAGGFTVETGFADEAVAFVVTETVDVAVFIHQLA